MPVETAWEPGLKTIRVSPVNADLCRVYFHTLPRALAGSTFLAFELPLRLDPMLQSPNVQVEVDVKYSSPCGYG